MAKEGGGNDTSVNTVTRRQLKIWPPVSARVLCLFTILLVVAEPSTTVGVLRAGAEARLSPEQNTVRLTNNCIFSSVRETSGLDLQPRGNRAEKRIVLAVVKEEGLKFLGSARAGRSLKAEENGAKVQKQSWGGKLARGNWLFLRCRVAR